MIDATDAKVQQRYRHLLNDDIRMCGCGSETKWHIIKMFLERSEHAEEGRESFYQPMGEICGEAVEFIAHVLDGWGLLEHGSSIGWAWPTQKGRDVLAFLREYGTDSNKWPEWWCSYSPPEEEW